MNRDGADAEFPFPLFLFFSASFKNSSPREKVAKLSSGFGTGGPSLCLYPLLYNIFSRANNGRSREKTKILAKRFAHAISVHYRDFEHAYVY